MAKNSDNHGIQSLTDYSHVRKKTEMYLGSRSKYTQEVFIIDENNQPRLKELTWVPAVFTAIREIIDNSLDEIIGHSSGDTIEVAYDEESGIFSVSDNGRGIPIDKDKKTGLPLAQLVLTQARTGRNFEVRGEVAGTNGIGASGVNFCSEWFELTIHRDGKVYNQRFEEGPDSSESQTIQDPVVKRSSSSRTGTCIRFKLSSKVFKDQHLPTEFLYSRVYEIAAANEFLKIKFNDKLIKTRPTIKKTIFGDRKDIIEITIENRQEKFKSRFILVPEFSANDEITHGIVNNIPTFNGGTHIDSFKRHFYSGLLSSMERDSKRRKLSPNKSDINAGLLIYSATSMTAPDFDSQSKTRLINEQVGAWIKEYFESDLVFKRIKRDYPEWIESIYTRCQHRTSKRDQADLKRAANRLRRKRVPSLRPATGKDRSKCILFLAEGLSAINGMASVRDPKIHGGLGLKGKVLNVNGIPAKKVLDNQALSDVMNSLGLVVGQKFDRQQLQYGKVYIAHDMDPDGLNIGALLLNFFYSYWPDMFDPSQPPIVHIFMTPFVIAEKGKQRKYWYAHDYQNFDPKDYVGWTITRAKGLGTLTNADWRHSLEYPVVFPVIADDSFKESLDLIFNSERADDRKEWIGL